MSRTSDVLPIAQQVVSRASRPARHARYALALMCWTLVATAHAAVITVNSLADNVYVSNTGATFSDTALTVSVTPGYCTLRMALAAANLDLAIGGVGGCSAGNSETLPGGQSSGIPDNIVFSVGLAGTINVDVSAKMSEAPAAFTSGLGAAVPGALAPNLTSALVASRPVEITGNVDGAGVPSIVLDGGLLANANVDGRILVASDGVNSVDSPIVITSLKFQNARQVGGTGGCMFSRESVRLTNVYFNNCNSVGSAAGNGYGGALGVFTSASPSSVLPHVRPNVLLRRVFVTNSKALLGTSTSSSAAGALAFGGGTGYVGNVSLESVTLDNNEADSVGAINIYHALNVAFNSVAMTNNRAIGSFNANTSLNAGFDGGGSIRSADSVSLKNVTANNNTAGQGNGGFEVRDVPWATVDMFTANGNAVIVPSANHRGTFGGLVFNGVANLSATKLVITNNTVDSGITPTPIAPATVSNYGICGGLCIINSVGNTEIRDSQISNNSINNGRAGGVYLGTNFSVLLERVRILGNTTTETAAAPNSGYAAMLAFNNGTFRLYSSEVSGNNSHDFASAIFNASFDDHAADGSVVAALPPLTNTVEIMDTVFHSNIASEGMVYLATPGIYRVRNVTIANNNASPGCRSGLSVDGYNPFSGTTAIQVAVQNTTIARNLNGNCHSALALGSFISGNPTPGAFNGTVNVESSILGVNAAAGATTTAIYAVDPSKLTLVKTLVEDNAGPISAQCGVNGNLCSIDPLLEALGANGGPTKTLRLLPGSPAINAGSNPAALAFDQRGATRVVGAAADMGAFETAATSGAVNCKLDMDGDNVVLAAKEGMVIARALLGFTDAAAVVGTGITLPQWLATKSNLNLNCGTSFP